MTTSSKLLDFYPVIETQAIPESSRFYRDHFGFEIRFETDWYVHLQREDGRALALLDPNHETVPKGFRRPVSGLLLNFEVEDVDHEYERLKKRGVPIVQELRDEAFGQRHFIVKDPSDVLVDVIKVIPPSAEYAAQYS